MEFHLTKCKTDKSIYVNRLNPNQKLAAKLVWQLNLSGADRSQRILRVAAKNHIEHVHSQGRVFNDRSVLYKYINPNLVAVATIGPDAIHKCKLRCEMVLLSGNWEFIEMCFVSPRYIARAPDRRGRRLDRLLDGASTSARAAAYCPLGELAGLFVLQRQSATHGNQ